MFTTIFTFLIGSVVGYSVSEKISYSRHFSKFEQLLELERRTHKWDGYNTEGLAGLNKKRVKYTLKNEIKT
jgi:hypothetical protein